MQRVIAWLAAPFWVPAAALVMRLGLGYRIRDVARHRARYREVLEESGAPLLVCANHLTMIDSFLVGWALGSPFWFLVHFDRLPWNVPEATNFAARTWSAVASYLAKCIPVLRGGRREDVARVLERIVHLLQRGEVAVMFPEGGRSRSGRVDVEQSAWGVGRVVAAVPDCRVLCVYLRGDHQGSWGTIPARGERFEVRTECIEPKSDHRGARRSRDLARQITAQLARMEGEYFDGRQ
ncbi:MAG: lysophospholipid acyltransferase family protein [Myxococcota bacterium]